MFKRKHNIGPSIFDGDRWNEIWDTISRNKKRSIMTAMGVFWGVFMLVVLMGVGMGLERYFKSAIGGASTNSLYMMSNQTSIPYKGMPISRWWNLSMDDITDVKRLIPEAQYVSGIMWGRTSYFSNGEQNGEYGIMGYTAEYQNINPSTIIFGRFLNRIDMDEKRKVCLIGKQVWKDLFPGGEDPCGQVIKMDNLYLTVIGVMEPSSSGISFGDSEMTVILPITLMQQFYSAGKIIHMLAVMGYDSTDLNDLEQKCRQIISANHIISPDDKKAIWVIDMSEMFGSIQGLLNGVNLLTWIVGLGTMLAGIVGISNIMLVTVRERTREIGVRRALGATPMMIISQILSESFILTFISGLLALALGVGLLSFADKMFAMMDKDISCQITFGLGLGALGIIIAGSLLAGVIPANRAIKIKAVDAIRDE